MLENMYVVHGPTIVPLKSQRFVAALWAQHKTVMLIGLMGQAGSVNLKRDYKAAFRVKKITLKTEKMV